MPAEPILRVARTGALDTAYLETGDPAGVAILLLHGFPYDPSAFAAVAAALATDGARVIMPYLRGFGATRFHDPDHVRSGEQAAIADDVHALLVALGIDRAILFGFDWGGRAACILGALSPDRVAGLVIAGGYLIQDIAHATIAAAPAAEQAVWHQYYLASARGRDALERDRIGLARHLRRQWSPAWPHHETALARAAPAFDNPDFAAIVWHSYAHRIGAVPGDPRYLGCEALLSAAPEIEVPTILIRGGAGPLAAGGGSAKFTRLVDQRIATDAGHNPAEEAPQIVIAALRDIVAATGLAVAPRP